MIEPAIVPDWITNGCTHLQQVTTLAGFPEYVARDLDRVCAKHPLYADMFRFAAFQGFAAHCERQRQLCPDAIKSLPGFR